MEVLSLVLKVPRGLSLSGDAPVCVSMSVFVCLCLSACVSAGLDVSFSMCVCLCVILSGVKRGAD